MCLNTFKTGDIYAILQCTLPTTLDLTTVYSATLDFLALYFTAHCFKLKLPTVVYCTQLIYVDKSSSLSNSWAPTSQITVCTSLTQTSPRTARRNQEIFQPHFCFCFWDSDARQQSKIIAESWKTYLWYQDKTVDGRLVEFSVCYCGGKKARGVVPSRC